MSSTSVILSSTDTLGNANQKTITDVNPNATNAQIKSFAQQLNALTSNTYGSTSRVNQEVCSSAVDLFETTITINGNAAKGNPSTATITADSLQGAADSAGFILLTQTPAEPVLSSAPAKASGTFTDLNVDDETYASTGIRNSVIDSAASDFASFYGWRFYPCVPNFSDSDCVGNFVVTFPEEGNYASATVTLTAANV